MNVIKSLMQKFYQKSVCVGLFTVSILCSPSLLNADIYNHQDSENLKLGICLETHYWKAVQNRNIKKFSSKLSPIFQGLNISGVYTRKQQIQGLSQATLNSFTLTNTKATRTENVLVFSYTFNAVGSGLTSGPSITIWKKHDHRWKIVSHSYVPFVQ